MTSYFKGRAAYLLRRAGEGVLESFLMGLHENRYNPKKETLDEAAMRYMSSYSSRTVSFAHRCIDLDSVWVEGCRLYAKHLGLYAKHLGLYATLLGYNRTAEEFIEKKARVIAHVQQQLIQEKVEGRVNLSVYRPMDYYKSLKEDV